MKKRIVITLVAVGTMTAGMLAASGTFGSRAKLNEEVRGASARLTDVAESQTTVVPAAPAVHRTVVPKPKESASGSLTHSDASSQPLAGSVENEPTPSPTAAPESTPSPAPTPSASPNVTVQQGPYSICKVDWATKNCK